MPKDHPNESAVMIMQKIADEMNKVVECIQQEEEKLVEAAAILRSGDLIAAQRHLREAQKFHLARGPIHHRVERLQDALAAVDPEYDVTVITAGLEDIIANDTLEETKNRLINHRMTCEHGEDCVAVRVYEKRIKSKS